MLKTYIRFLSKPLRRRSPVLRLACSTALAVVLAACGGSGSPEALRVGVLKYGTVNWELAVVRANGLARERGVDLEVLPLASENALAVALQAGRVDLIVSNWLWAARQRAGGHRYQFAPYSLAVGAVMVNPGAGIETVADLKGRKLGIAGGPVDKTWLLLRAYADKAAATALDAAAEPTYAAPPIVNELMLDGRLTAAINFWHYNARLQAQGMTPLLTVEHMLAGMGMETVPPLLGWVFREDWAKANRGRLTAFLEATFKAKSILAESDAAWEDLRHLVKPENDAVFAAVKAGYRAGIPRRYGRAEIDAARDLFALLAAQGGGELTGGLDTLPADVFWDGFRL